MDRFTRERWSKLWSRLDARGDPNVVFDDLIKRYSKPPRVYHTAEHIDHCLAEFDSVYRLIVNPDAVELALWVHDVDETESESAQYLIGIGSSFQMRRSVVVNAVGIVLATDHKISFSDFDKRYGMDIDLAILGQPIEVFDVYDRRIREEYRQFSDEEYRKGRSIVLNKFLDRGDRIYSTPSFQKRYGAQAKANLLRAISRL